MKEKSLDPREIAGTIERLGQRIEERFPDSGLSQTCSELLELGRGAQERSALLARPILWLRLATWLLIVLAVAAIAATLLLVPLRRIEAIAVHDLVQLVEAGTNELVALGAGLFFLVSLETRIKRRRALRAIHELRSVAHVIDMHQLTKDPERMLHPGIITPSSPTRSLSRFELGRYLDYCSEMLSLVGKIAALYVERFDDAVALASANEVETLATGLSRKIWQKLMVLHTHGEEEAILSRVDPRGSARDA